MGFGPALAGAASQAARSGGAGVPARGALRPPARSSLTAGRQACPRLEGQGPPKRGAAPESRRRGEAERQKARPGRRKTAGRRAERRHAVRKGRVQTDWPAPPGTPSPSLSSSEGPDSKTRAPARRENDGACPNDENRIPRPPRSHRAHDARAPAPAPFRQNNRHRP
jgi:hypothetical protein